MELGQATWCRTHLSGEGTSPDALRRPEVCVTSVIRRSGATPDAASYSTVLVRAVRDAFKRASA